jgi:hypothetical protein
MDGPLKFYFSSILIQTDKANGEIVLKISVKKEREIERWRLKNDATVLEGVLMRLEYAL